MSSTRFNWDKVSKQNEARNRGHSVKINYHSLKGPTQKQRLFIRKLAKERGMDAIIPDTRVQASIEIDRLIRMPRKEVSQLVTRTVPGKALTRKQRVFNVLKSLKWIPGYELTTVEVGGTEGLRRVRELRAEGYNIKVRRTDEGTFEYRMVSSKPQG